MKKITIPVNVAVENRTYMRGKYTEKDIRPDDLEILLSGGHAVEETETPDPKVVKVPVETVKPNSETPGLFIKEGSLVSAASPDDIAAEENAINDSIEDSGLDLQPQDLIPSELLEGDVTENTEKAAAGDNAEGQAALELGQDKTTSSTGANKKGGNKKK